MNLTKSQKTFLKTLNVLNVKGVAPNILQLAAEGGLSWGQTLYQYKVCGQLVTKGLVQDIKLGRTHKLTITEEGTQALEMEERK